MDWFYAFSEQTRTILVFLAGLVIATQVNRGIYRLAWNPRAIGPWSAPAPGAPPRRWFDRLPFLGWVFLQREQKLHGTAFWVRPALIEVGLAAGLAALYLFEMRGGLDPPNVRQLPLDELHQLHQRFMAHAVLICLMTVATFIDLDEQTIPDAITVPGALVGLIFAALWPAIRLPVEAEASPGVFIADLLQLASPSPWLPPWNGIFGLVVGCGLFLAWCWALVPTTITLRRGWRNAVRFYIASFFRDAYWKWMAATAVFGCGGIAWIWSLGGERWESLLSQLTGLFFGGALVWSVRITAGIALRKEAMGFGDVTLMAMIGAFVGWQPPLLIFFLSPFAALFVSLTQWVLTRRRDIAFGPYLCLATVFLLVAWPTIWQRVEGVFWMGWLVPAMFLACLCAMMGLLMLIRIAEEVFSGGGNSEER